MSSTIMTRSKSVKETQPMFCDYSIVKRMQQFESHQANFSFGDFGSKLRICCIDLFFNNGKESIQSDSSGFFYQGITVQNKHFGLILTAAHSFFKKLPYAIGKAIFPMKKGSISFKIHKVFIFEDFRKAYSTDRADTQFFDYAFLLIIFDASTEKFWIQFKDSGWNLNSEVELEKIKELCKDRKGLVHLITPFRLDSLESRKLNKITLTRGQTRLFGRIVDGKKLANRELTEREKQLNVYNVPTDHGHSGGVIGILNILHRTFQPIAIHIGSGKDIGIARIIDKEVISLGQKVSQYIQKNGGIITQPVIEFAKCSPKCIQKRKRGQSLNESGDHATLKNSHKRIKQHSRDRSGIQHQKLELREEDPLKKSISTSLHLAANQVKSGQANCVIALSFKKMFSGSLSVSFSDRENPIQPFIRADVAWHGDTASKVPAAPKLFGNAGREHIQKYGTKPEHFSRVAYKNYKHSGNNPSSQFRDEYPFIQHSLEEIMKGPVVHQHMNKLWCCPTSDGAACAIFVSEEFVRSQGLEDQTVEILVSELLTDTRSTFDDKSNMKLVGWEVSKACAAQVYRKTGFGSGDVSVVELHDCFSTNELVTYEALGLCPEGKGKIIDLGDFTYWGKVVVNPSGGLISKGHPLGATGLAQCAELCQQLRGMAEKSQVNEAKIVLQHNMGLGGAIVIIMCKKQREGYQQQKREDQTSNPDILEKLEEREALQSAIL